MVERARKYIEITADASKALAELRKLNAAAERTETRLRGIGSIARDLGFTLRAMAAGIVVDQFIGLADAATNLNSQLKAITGSAEAADTQFQDLLEIANQNGVAVDSLAGAFTRLSTALPNVPAEKINETLNLLSSTLAKTGAGTQQANSVMLQFAQGMGSAALQGDEFRAVAENAPTIIRSWAKAIGQADVAFKDLSSSAALTAQSFYENIDAIIANQNALLGAEGPALTLGRAFQQLRNNVIALFVDVGKGEGLTNLAEGVVAVADAVEHLETPINVALNLIGALIELAGSVGSVLLDAASSIGAFAGNAADSLVGLFTDAKTDAIDYGDFIGYMFEITLPYVIESFGATVEQTWEAIRASAAITVAYLTEIWPQVKVVGLEAFALLADGAYNTMYDLADSVLRVLTDMVNGFKKLLNLAIEGVNTLGGDFEPFSIEPFKGLTREFNNFGEAAASARSELSALQASNAATVATAQASVKAVVAETEARVEANKLKREDARITRNLGTAAASASKEMGAFASSTNKAGGAAKKAGGSASKAAKELEKVAIALAKGNQEIEDYIADLEQQIYLEGLSEEARADAVVQIQLQEKAQKLLNKATEESLKGNDELAAAYRTLAQSWEDAIPQAQKLSKQLRDMKDEVDVLGDVFSSVGDSFADAFGDFFASGLRDADDFIDSLKDILISGVKDIVSGFAKNTIKVAVNAVVSATGTGTTTTAGAVSGATGGSAGSLSNISRLFGGTSIGESISSGLTSGFETIGLSMPGWLDSGLSKLATTSNLSLGLGGIVGGLLGNAIFGGEGLSSVGSSVGSTLGSLIGGAAFGGIGAVAGGLLGGAGGGFLGSLFGDEEETPFGRFAISGGTIVGAGGSGLGAETVNELNGAVGSLNETLDAFAEVLGPEAQAAREAFTAFSPELREDWMEGWLTGITREIIQSMIEAVPGALGNLYANVAAQFTDTEGLADALDELSTYIATFGVALEAVQPESISTLEDAAGVLNKLALEEIPGATTALFTLAELMESVKTQAEKTADAQARVNEAFSEAGLTVPQTVGELRALVDSLDFTTVAGLEAAAVISTVATDLSGLLEPLEETGEAVAGLTSQERLIASFRDEVRRNEQDLIDMTRMFADWGLQLPPTTDALADLVEAGAYTEEQMVELEKNTTALGNAFAALESLTDEAVEALESASAARIDALEAESDATIEALNAQKDARIDALDAEKDAVQENIDAVTDSVSGLSSIIDSVRKAVFGLEGQAAFEIDANRQRLLEEARGAVASGTVPDSASEIISGLSSVNAKDFASREEYLAAIEENQDALDALGGMARAQLTEGERQIDLLEQQIDSLDAQISATEAQTEQLIAAEKAALAERIAAEEALLAQQTEEIASILHQQTQSINLGYLTMEQWDEHKSALLASIATSVAPLLTLGQEEEGEGSGGLVGLSAIDPFVSGTLPNISSPNVVTSSSGSGNMASSDLSDIRSLLLALNSYISESTGIVKRWNGEGIPPDRNDYMKTTAENTA